MSVSFLISTPVSFYGAHKWLESFPYRIQPGWQIFILAGIICLGVTMLTISFQAIRTAFVNPAEQLRND